ncbi:hypothetical protein [Streptomyces meridianus]|uniref:Uncharacterized protein n=1 Tax=Streptomyces meridianus TaxID=2938945 RepID=A0ABT0XB43_9ACTN|nr:hypothetical protein [Streptomyces meridianus]MCM2579034.1 hypothetical protein [Streptomyces meridianus]
MAIRKATIKEHVAQAIAQANPGDRPHVTIATVTGPSPWLTNAMGLVGQLLVKFYFVTVTDQAVVLHRYNRFTQRPQEVAYAIPRDQAPQLMGDVQRNPLWSSFRFLLPGEMQPTRMNVHRIWRDEMDQVIGMITGAPHGMAPQGMSAPGVPQHGMPAQSMAPYGAPAPAPAFSQQQPHGTPAPAPHPQQAPPYGGSAPSPAPQQQPPYGSPADRPGASPYGAQHTPMPGNPYAG